MTPIPARNVKRKLWNVIDSASRHPLTQKIVNNFADALVNRYMTPTARFKSGKRSRYDYSLGGNFTYDRKKRRWGRKPRKNLRYAIKKIKQGSESVVYRYQAMNRFDSVTAGFTPCKFFQFTDGGAVGQQVYPVHLFNLSGRTNLVRATNSDTSVAYTPLVRYFLYKNNDTATGTYGWLAMKGQKANGTTDGGGTLGTGPYQAWQVEYSDHAQFSNNVPLDSDTLDWVQAKFMLYGTNSLPVKWTIQIVQFNDPWIAPQTYCVNYPGGDGLTNYDPGRPVPDAKGLREANNFLGNLVQKLCYSPMATPTTGHIAAKMKVLRSYSCVINPNFSIENPSGKTGTVVTPHQRQVDMFIRFNRNQNYAWEGKNAIDPDDPTFDDPQQTTINVDVPFKARLYMLVTATCAESEQGTTAQWLGTAAPNVIGSAYTPVIRYQPSYDVLVRKKHSKIAFR